jgi:hypothetical protein
MQTTLKGGNDDVTIIKHGLLMVGNTYNDQLSRPSRCFQHQVEFVFGERPRKPIILKVSLEL